MINYNNTKSKYLSQRQKGFTLVEIMVATSIFMIIMLIAIGSIIVASDTAKKSQKLRFAIDNVNFAIENMSRSIRMGTQYYCASSGTITDFSGLGVQDCTAGNFIGFIPSLPPAPTKRMGYQLETRTSGAKRPDGSYTNTLKRCDNMMDDATIVCTDIVSPDIDIQTLKFTVKGSTQPAFGDTVQPSVYIAIKGAINIKGTWTSFALQTMAAQRSTE